MAKRYTLVVVAGPTASGKTALSIALAQFFNTSILSFDSRQCYRELNIGVARPSVDELNAAKHFFIASHSIHQPVDAAAYETYALQALDGIFANQPIAIAVGGTGLYMKTLCHGIDPMPEVDEKVRQELRSAYEKNGLTWLQQQVQNADPLFAAEGEMQNPHRLLRALEVMLCTGTSIRNFQKQQSIERPFNIVKIGIEMDRPQLNERINHRVDLMMQQGLPDEVKNLQDYQHLQALQTVGYAEIFQFLKGESTLAEAVEKIKTNTRRYAKRQMTWFKKDETIHWFKTPTANEIIHWLLESKGISAP